MYYEEIEDLVSVIIPVYNVSEYLDRCMESVVKQSYKNIEIVLLNDGSTDDSLLKCMEWKKKDYRVIVVDKENEGLGITRNLGIRMAKGKYIIFIDSDDYVDRALVEKLRDCVVRNHAKMAFCNMYNVTEEGCVSAFCNLDLEGSTNFFENKLLLTEMPVYLWGKIFEREMLIKNELWMTEHYIEDAEFVPKLLSVCDAVAQEKALLYYYVNNRPGSILYSKKRQIIEQLPEIFDNVVDYLKKYDKFDDMKLELEAYLTGKYFRVFYDNLKDRKPFKVGDEEKFKDKIEKKLEEIFPNGKRQWKDKKRERFLLWGSPLLRGNVIQYNVESYFVSGEYLKRYHFSSLISAMQEKQVLQSSYSEITNLFRKKMIEKEMQCYFIKKEQKKDIDVVLIDFLEERYDIAEYQGGYYTMSDEFQKLGYLQGKEYRVLKRDSKEVWELWKKSCDTFIKLIWEANIISDIHLIKNYINQDIKDSDCSVNMQQMNVILDRYYTYFEKQCERIKREL